jgi:FkbM family methyltransferase
MFLQGDYQKKDLLSAVDLVAKAGCPLGGRFVDAGAHLGSSTVYALKSGHFSEAICCEPEPRNLRLLRANLALNEIDDRVTVYPVALSDHAGTFDLELSPDNNRGDHRLVSSRSPIHPPEAMSESRRTRISVHASTLDEILDRSSVAPGSVSLVWLDTQGHEGFVLAGASRVIQARVPFVIEFWPYGMKRAGCLDSLLTLIGTQFRTYYDLAEGIDASARSASTIGDIVARIGNTLDSTDLLLIPR